MGSKLGQYGCFSNIFSTIFTLKYDYRYLAVLLCQRRWYKSYFFECRKTHYFVLDISLCCWQTLIGHTKYLTLFTKYGSYISNIFLIMQQLKKKLNERRSLWEQKEKISLHIFSVFQSIHEEDSKKKKSTRRCKKQYWLKYLFFCTTLKYDRYLCHLTCQWV